MAPSLHIETSYLNIQIIHTINTGTHEIHNDTIVFTRRTKLLNRSKAVSKKIQEWKRNYRTAHFHRFYAHKKCRIYAAVCSVAGYLKIKTVDYKNEIPSKIYLKGPDIFWYLGMFNSN